METSDRKAEVMERAEEYADSFTWEEQELFRLLKTALTEKTDRKKLNISALSDDNRYEKVIAIARAHQVLPLLYEVLEQESSGWAECLTPGTEAAGAAEALQKSWQQAARQTVSQNYHLLFTGKFLTGILREAGIPVVLLKGTATSYYYPVPELRKSGDVDLYLFQKEDLEKAQEIFTGQGLIHREEQHSLHHLVMQTGDGIVVELHTLIAEPFDNAAMNAYMEKCREIFAAHTKEREIMGVTLPVLTGACHAYELLLHMLQHFLRAGFGLKLLCDWVVFWKKGLPLEEQKLYERLVTESGLKGFSDTVTEVCVEYLGLPKESVRFMKNGRKEKLTEAPGRGVGAAEHDLAADFLRDVLDSEEFGSSSPDRMVAVRGSGFGAYVCEFHHQMHLNFPKAGRCFLLWPLLWSITLVRFLQNNRRIRHTSAKEILRNAGRRGKLVKELSLFEK